jgi:uncharacterized Tic20 family protein
MSSYDDDDDDRPRKKKKKRGLKDDEKQMAMFCHLGTLVGGFIIPLIIWMIKKEESRFVDRHGKEALNFNISLFIYYMVGGILTCGLIIFVLGPLALYWCIMAGMAANRGEYYEYPMTIRFIT